MGGTLHATIGFDGSEDVFIPDALGEPFDLLSATLDAKVWRGGDESPLFTPSVVAIEDEPGWATVSWTIANVATLDPGSYPALVGVTVGGVRYVGFEGAFEVARGPGSAPARKVYGSEEDLQLAASRIGLVLPKDSGLAAALDVRAEAKEEIDRRIWDCYCPRPGFIFRRAQEWDPVVCGHDYPDPTAVPPTKDEIAAYLAADGLEVDEHVREMASWFAASLIFRRQLPDTSGKYRALADDLMLRFESAWRKYRPRIDTDDDGEPDIELGRGSVTFLEGA
jgi:hypothetical protein